MAGENLQSHGDGQIFAEGHVATDCPTPGSRDSWPLKSPCRITWRPAVGLQKAPRDGRQALIHEPKGPGAGLWTVHAGLGAFQPAAGDGTPEAEDDVWDSRDTRGGGGGGTTPPA